jgi:Nif-specific regulatory protein
MLACPQTAMPHRPDPDAPGAPPTDWHTQELLLMREVMKLVGRSLAPGHVLREMLHLMSELLGLTLRQFSHRLRKAGLR